MEECSNDKYLPFSVISRFHPRLHYGLHLVADLVCFRSAHSWPRAVGRRGKSRKISQNEGKDKLKNILK